MNITNDKDIIEEFCGACLAVPLAFAGIGTDAYGINSRGRYKQKKKMMKYSIIASVILTLFSFFFWWYFYVYKKLNN